MWDWGNESMRRWRLGPAVRFASKPGLAPAGDSLSLASPRESKQREGDPMVWVPSLRYGQPAVLAENGAGLELASLRQSPVLIRFRLRSSAQPDGWRKKTNIQIPRPGTNPECMKRAALHGRESQRTVMRARECSARGHMRLPSLAQRGEGRAGGWEWGVETTACGELQVQREARKTQARCCIFSILSPMRESRYHHSLSSSR